MLEKPDLPDEKIIACVQDAYGLSIAQAAFLPLGADLNTAVYRLEAGDGTAYFFKLRRGAFDETSVTLPKFLHDQGSDEGRSPIIAPLPARSGQLWAGLDDFKTILYPFVEGQDGYQIPLTDRQWRDFGAALKRIHTLEIPPALRSRIRRETYSPRWREIARAFMEEIGERAYADPVAARMSAFLQDKRDAVLDLVERAERLAQALQEQPRPLVLCHSDLHAGNLLIAGPETFYIVDWDDPILAPKERDLMYPGGGQFAGWRTPQEEEALFYQGYYPGDPPGGLPAQVDPYALAYYRYERIIEDIAVYCQQIFSSNEGGEDREQALYDLETNFWPDHTIDIAYRSDRTPGGGRP